MAYSGTDDLLLGNIPLPAADKAKRAVERAADEIDSFLGVKYRVPINPMGAQSRQVKSLLLTINNWLASGRLIEELTASSQTVEVHAYAQNLINQAISALRAIVAGEIMLPGCELVSPETGMPVETGPLVVNVDESSPTQFHYDEITNPLFSVQNPNAMETLLAPSIRKYYLGG